MHPLLAVLLPVDYQYNMNEKIMKVIICDLFRTCSLLASNTTEQLSQAATRLYYLSLLLFSPHGLQPATSHGCVVCQPTLALALCVYRRLLAMHALQRCDCVYHRGAAMSLGRPHGDVSRCGM